MSNVDELVDAVEMAIVSSMVNDLNDAPGDETVRYMRRRSVKAAIKAVHDALQEQWHNSPMKPTVIESSDDYLLGWGRCREVAGVYLLKQLED